MKLSLQSKDGKAIIFDCEIDIAALIRADMGSEQFKGKVDGVYELTQRNTGAHKYDGDDQILSFLKAKVYLRENAERKKEQMMGRKVRIISGEGRQVWLLSND